MQQPTELALQVQALTAVAELTHAAALAGVPQDITPMWTVDGGFATGHLISTDVAALTVLDAWRRVAGGRVETATRPGPDGPRCVWALDLTYRDVSIHLYVSVPSAATPRRTAVPA